MSKITLFEHFDYGTPSYDFSDAVEHLEDTAGKASSCQVEGSTWILYHDPEFMGHSAVLTPGHYARPDDMFLGNDALHSMRPLPDNGICLFSEPNFCGVMVTVQEGDTNSSLTAKSAIVITGEWTLCTGAGFGGNTHDVKIGRYPKLPAALHNDIASSVKGAENGNLLIVSRTQEQANNHPNVAQFQLNDKPTVELIIDASGSMYQNNMAYNGQTMTRMAVAKEVLRKVVRELPDGIQIVLRAFGTESSSTDCKEQTKRLISYGELNKDAVIKQIDDLVGKQGTPIAASLGKVKDDLKDAKGSTLVVLVTDGGESCARDATGQYDMLAVDRAIAEIKTDPNKIDDLVLNIVGFDVTEELKKTFGRWAEAGNGHYYDASNADQFNSELKKALGVPYTVYKGSESIGSGYIDGDSVELRPESNPSAGYSVLLTRDMPPKFIASNLLITAGKTTEISVIRG